MTAPLNQLPVYQSFKFPLKKLVSKQSSLTTIEDAVQRVQLIRRRVSDFVKLYCCHLYETDQSLPHLDKAFYKLATDVVCEGSKLERGSINAISKRAGHSSSLDQQLIKFYHEYYQSTLYDATESISRKNLSHILSSMYEEMETVQTTNITSNFYKYVARFVNICGRSHIYQEKGWVQDYKMTKEEKSVVYKLLRCVKDDIWLCRQNDEMKTPSAYRQKVEEIRSFILPCIDSISEANVGYDVKEHPYKYFPYMIKMNKWFEAQRRACFSVFSLRTDLIPGYIKIDSSAMVDLLMTKQDAEDLSIMLDLPELKGVIDLYSKVEKLAGESNHNIKLDDFGFKTEKWKYVCNFGTNKHTRKLLQTNNYIFGNTILTDGVGATVLMLRKDLRGANRFKRGHMATAQSRGAPSDAPYLCDLSQEELDFISKNCIRLGNDPGKHNIITIGSKKQPGQKLKILRYTSQQRQVECRHKKNKRAIVAMKKNIPAFNESDSIPPYGYGMKGDDETRGPMVNDVEQLLHFNAKSCTTSVFRQAIKCRRILEKATSTMYSEPVLRKLRFSAYSHTRSSEDRLLQHIVKTFSPLGQPIAIMWGNWSMAKHLKNFIPTPGAGLRKRLMRRGSHLGIKIYRVVERNTSKVCHDCGIGHTEYVKKRTYKKVDKITGDTQAHTKWVHGLLRCNNNESCGRLWNRDSNGYLNILEIAESILEGRGIPDKFK